MIFTPAPATGGGGGASFTPLTAGDLTVVNDGSDGAPFVATYDNAAVNALGGIAVGTLKVATLPAKTIVHNVFVRTAVELDLIALTVSVGRTSATFVDYVVASNHKTVAIYGNASAERGTNNTGYDVPSWTATTDVYVRFDAGGETLDLASIAATSYVVIEYSVIP